MSTYARERHYRAWWLREHLDLPLLEAYQELAGTIPAGIGGPRPIAGRDLGKVAKGARPMISRFSGKKVWPFCLSSCLVSMPATAGVADILSLLNTIVSTLRGGIGSVL